MILARFSILALLLAAALAANPKTASAQWWIGGSNHHHHDASGHRVDDAGHHIDNHGNHTGWTGVFDGDHSNEPHYTNNYSDSYYYTPSYSSSNSVPRTTYYSPSDSSSIVTNVLPRPAAPATRGGPIEINFPAGLQGKVNYSLNNYKYAIESGQSQVIESDRAWTIVFDRGSNSGSARYSLTPGTYEFTVTEKGWELVKKRAPQPQLADSSAPAPPAPVSTNSAAATPTVANSELAAPTLNAVPATAPTVATGTK